MDIQESWEKAKRLTEIVRPRLQGLLTFEATDLPYILLSESAVNLGDTAVRKGRVKVEKPTIVLPTNLPQFEGFDFEKELHFNQDSVLNFLLVRGVTFPSLKYNNETYSLDIYEGKLNNAREFYLHNLEKEEDVHSGLIIGPEDCWQFSLLIFICLCVARSAEGDIKRLLERFKRERRD